MLKARSSKAYDSVMSTKIAPRASSHYTYQRFIVNKDFTMPKIYYVYLSGCSALTGINACFKVDLFWGAIIGGVTFFVPLLISFLVSFCPED